MCTVAEEGDTAGGERAHGAMRIARQRQLLPVGDLIEQGRTIRPVVEDTRLPSVEPSLPYPVRIRDPQAPEEGDTLLLADLRPARRQDTDHHPRPVVALHQGVGIMDEPVAVERSPEGTIGELAHFGRDSGAGR